MEMLADSRLGDSSFHLVVGKFDVETGDVFTIRYLIDDKYFFTLMRDKGPSGDIFQVKIMPSEMLYTQVIQSSQPFEVCFDLIQAWVSDIEKEFYAAEEYKQTVNFRDQFLKVFLTKYGNNDETFDPPEIVLIEGKLKLFEEACEPLFKASVKLEPGEKTLHQLVDEIGIDANIFTRKRWVEVGGSKIFYLIKKIYPNITHSATELEAAQKLIQTLLT